MTVGRDSAEVRIAGMAVPTRYSHRARAVAAAPWDRCVVQARLVDGIQAEPCPELVAGVLHRSPAVLQVGAVRPGNMHEQAVAELLLAVAAFDRPVCIVVEGVLERGHDGATLVRLAIA